MSDEVNPKAIGYFRFNKKEQLLDPDKAEVYTPCPPWDIEAEHLKNVAKKKGLGTYKVNSPEQRVAIKQSCAEFDRANRITREEFMDKVREVLTAEYKWNGRVRITKDGIQDIVRSK